MKVIFLGTNGWYGTDTGATVCTLIDAPGGPVILDAGDGIHKADRHIAPTSPVVILLSHVHIDHISGLHILNKFDFQGGLSIYGPPGTADAIRTIVAPPYTVPLDGLRYPAVVRDLREGAHRLPFSVECRGLVHTAVCFGYRISSGGRTIAYCADTGYCAAAVELARGADLCIAECSYAPSQRNSAWPHLNPEEAARIALEAGARRLALTHFDARIYSNRLLREEARRAASGIFKETVAAYDDMVIEL